MEKDDELKGAGNSYDFGARIYDPRIGRWLLIDKRFKEYSCYSPYNFGLNNPVYYIDNDGNVIWDPVNNREVVVTYDKRGKPTYLLDNGRPVSHTFIRQSAGVLNSLAKSNQGKQLIGEMMHSPTRIKIKEDARVTPEGEFTERTSGIEPTTNKKGEAEMQAAGFDKILSESELPGLQAMTKANYEPLFNQAAFRQYLYRIEKNQLIDESVSVIGQGAKQKNVNRAFETVNLMSTKEMDAVVKAVDALSKIKI